MARVRRQESGISGTGKGDDSLVWNVAVYIRLSREDGNDESESVVNQKKILAEFLESAFVGQFTIADYYIDDGLSGTNDTRADFMRMIQDIEQGKVNCVICKTLSRAFRNYSDQGYYLESYFPQKRVRFISTGDPKIDTYTNPEVITGLEVPITGLMNDRYAAKTSSDVRRTFNTKRRKGEFIGAFAPYGYLKDPADKNHLILDENIMPIKRDMLRWFVQEGMSLGGIARKLNELGVPNPTAYKSSLGLNYNNPRSKENDGLWNPVTVKRILTDKVNLGHMVQGKQRVISYKIHDRIVVPEDEWFVKENTHEPTFTQEEYDAVLRLLARDTRTPNGGKKLHLFSGFLKCYDCGKGLQRSSPKGTAYYACRTYKEKSKTACTKHSIREDALEAAVLATIQAQIALLDNLTDIIDNINKRPAVNTQSGRIERLLNERSKELEKARALLDGLYVDWKCGEVSYDSYRRMKAKYEEQIEKAAAVIRNLEDEQKQLGLGVRSNDDVFEEFRQYQNIRRLDRGILVELVDTIYVHEDNEITIVFRFQDELQRIADFVESNTPDGNPHIFLP